MKMNWNRPRYKIENKELFQIETEDDVSARKKQHKENSRIGNTKEKKWERKITRTASFLQKDLPKSEVWFQRLYKGFMVENDKLNDLTYGKYIPDIINHTYKYLIEIDGTSHENNIRKWKDKKRDLFFKEKGYITFRVKAYDSYQASSVIQQVVKLRKEVSIIRELLTGLYVFNKNHIKISTLL